MSKITIQKVEKSVSKSFSMIPRSSYFTGEVDELKGLFLKDEKGGLTCLTSPGIRCTEVAVVNDYCFVEPIVLNASFVPRTITFGDIPHGTVFKGRVCDNAYEGIFLKCTDESVVMLFGDVRKCHWEPYQHFVEVSGYEVIDLKVSI